MSPSVDRISVYLEVGTRRTFAGAIDWPGWCRSGKDEEAALAALFAYGSRYQRALRGARVEFHPPTKASALRVVERLPGDATTDFGAPGARPSADAAPVDPAELRRLLAIVKAAWRTFDAAVETAEGKELRKGPRGGGRDVPEIVRHLVDADGGYLGRIGVKLEIPAGLDPAERLRLAREPSWRRLPEIGRGHDADHRAARGRALEHAHLRPAPHLARPRSRVGDRGSDGLVTAQVSRCQAQRISRNNRAGAVLRPFGSRLAFRLQPYAPALCSAASSSSRLTRPSHCRELFSIPVEQEDVGLDPVAELALEVVIARVVDVQVDEVDLLAVLLFEPVHDGRQSLAGRSPEGEELDQRRLAGGQVHRRRVGRFLSAAQRRGRRR